MTNLPLTLDQLQNPDPVLTSKLVTHLKSQGIFDQFRKECMADVDTKPAYQNLRQRVEGSVAAFLRKNPWKPDMNKNQMRDNLRRYIQSGGFLDTGVNRIVDQVVNPKIYTVFLPKVEEVMSNCLGMENDKLTFKPPPCREEKPEPTQFQNKHNLAPRARIPCSLTGQRMPSVANTLTLKPAEPQDTKKILGEDSGSSEHEETTNDNFLLNEEDTEDTADDDEESPAFEPHSETDRLILGVRTDTSDSNSEDSQVVITIVDDNLEERIDNDDKLVKEESDDKEIKDEDDSSSDEYVPKTPTINMEGSDGSTIEFNSISEYRQYQTKFDEVNFGNVEEEIVSSHWVDENSQSIKEGRSSNEEDSEESLRKRKLNIDDDDDDDDDSSSADKGDNSDEMIKPATFPDFPKKLKLEEVEEFDDEESESASEYVVNDIDDSNSERPIDMLYLKMKMSGNELTEKSKGSSSSSKESGKSHRHHHNYQDQHDSLSCDKNSSKEKVSDKESTAHSSQDKREGNKKDDISRDRNKDKERKKSDSSSSKYSDKDNRHKHNDKDKERHGDKKRTDKSEVEKKDKDDSGKGKKESRHEHKDRSKDHHHKDKKHDHHDKNIEERKIHESSRRHDKDKRDSSKSSRHSHSSSKHSHKSSSESNISDQKHRESSDRHKSQSKKSDKDSKHESRKKPREHCKSRDKDNDGRRSTDRDSNGPSSRSQLSSTSTMSSRSSSSRNQTETSETGDRTTSNSDNAVSDNIETVSDEANEQGIASPDPEPINGFWSDANSELNESRDSLEHESCGTDDDSRLSKCANVKELDKISCDDNFVKCEETEQLENTGENIFMDVGSEHRVSMPTSSVHDTTSEKENIEHAAINNEFFKADETLSNKHVKVGKFKKPKIAANIFEVKKIMQARRHLKRMEEMKMKLLVKDNAEECSIKTNALSQNNSDQNQDEIFIGFEEALSNKIEIYNCLINRLKSEITTSSNEVKNSNLVTSWIDVDPSLDEYIETVLKGKVHRKTRVRLPPICEDYYRYDAEQNVYILLERNTESPTLDEGEVDSNLNNLNPVMKNKEVFNNALYHDCQNKFNGNNSKSKDNLSQDSKFNEVEKKGIPLQENKDEVNRKSPKRKIVNEQPQIIKDVLGSYENTPDTGDIAENISQKLINDVIGIKDGLFRVDPHNEDVQSRDVSGDTSLREGNLKQQHYNTTDLYKPRPQISTRRARGRPPSEADTPTPTATGRKRAAAPEVNATTPKRRR